MTSTYERTVTTQTELDQALADKVSYIEIRSPKGVWIYVGDSGSATVRAFDSATVRASRAVAVHLHSARVKVEGGVVIDVSKPITDGAEWCEHHGVDVDDTGVATLFKAVNDQWTTGYGFDYSPDATPSAPDWRADNECGGGLHFSPTPDQALAYHPDATKFVAVGVDVADLRPIPGSTAKAKAPRVVRGCVEVDVLGNVVIVDAAVSS